MTRLKQEIYDLLKTWCDGLVKYQITEIDDSNLKGGILCPACSIIHGRCGNAIPAMLYMAEQEQDEKYIRCAEGLIDWSEQLLCPDGGFVNDTESEWKGITTFAFISLCDAYFGHGHMLNDEYRQKLYHQVTATLDYLVNTFDGKCVEMEGAAIAHTAYLNDVPYVIIRAISDKADNSATMDYPTFEKQAAKCSVKLLKNMLYRL